MSTELEAIVAQARSKLLADVTDWEPRLLAMTVVRLVDWLYLMPPAETSLLRRWHSSGAPLILQMLPPKCLDAPGWLANPSTHMLEVGVGLLMQTAAKIAFCERALANARIGLGAVSRTDEGFVITYPSFGIDLERIDREDEARILQSTYDDAAEDIAEDEALRQMEPEVDRLTTALVGTWHEHFISYAAHPLLDDFFWRRANLYVRYQLSMSDTFDPDASFGGMPYLLLREVVAVLVAIRMKHLAFVGALHAKSPDLRIPNLISIVDDLGQLVPAISAHLDNKYTEAEVERAAHFLTYCGESDKDLLRPGETLAPLMQVGEGFFMHSVQGTLDVPFYFLFKKLRRDLRRDWDIAVNRRERAFVGDLARLLGKPGFSVVDRQVELREEGKTLTDIDASVFDPSSGVLAVFQLKWQDPFGFSPAERLSRSRNLLETGNEWVARVLRWLDRYSVDHLVRKLGITRAAPVRVLLFVLSRTHAHFSGATGHDSRAAWGNWSQLARLARGHASSKDLLGDIHAALATEFEERRRRLIGREEEEIELGEWKIRVAYTG